MVKILNFMERAYIPYLFAAALTTAASIMAFSFRDSLTNVIQKPDRPFSTAFRHWEDGIGNSKKDKRIDLDELVGKSDSFFLPDEEIIRFATRILDSGGKTVHFSLYSQSGKLICEYDDVVKSDDYVKWVGIKADFLSKKVKGKEEYIAVWEISEKNRNERETIDEYRVTLINE